MEEIEKLKRAKMYIEKLADGINPLDDTEVEESDTINNVRLSRCFFYVADILRQVIENGGVVKKERRAKQPFFITDQALGNFAYSDEPIPITYVVERINNLINQDEMKKLFYKIVIDWLKEVGLLEDANGRFGTARTCPTEQGKSIGISIERRVGTRGEYFITYYNRNAQEFIINHIQVITGTSVSLED